ncbi:MAG: glycosyl transferase family 2 [uncultured bacterium]|nr:MAG: glycosyl transferase family 2 [uncultured bacterium]KKU14796.1 MAG: Glycosyl transferase family 2 [Microgenomates group bacterium GW2011_GWC2_45_8]KKU26237.1 MAG: Glycosyl transferase family 2 [Microgenomates group bacterium GW2011_GWA2_46_16]
MKLPKISVITPSYNQGKYIRATIESVLSQDYPNLEYFVIDGGSTDGTVEILKSYGNKIRWVSEHDAGQADAINKGLAVAKGEILAYLNSDDIYLPGALKRVGEYYAQTKADWITGDCLVIDEQGNISKNNWLISGYKRFLMTLYSSITLRIADSMLPQPSTFWSRQAYKKIGDFNIKYHYVMDYDYWLRMAKYYHPHDLKVALSGFRSQDNSKSVTSRDKLMAEGLITLKENGTNNCVLWLHKLHSELTLFIYKLIK